MTRTTTNRPRAGGAPVAPRGGSAPRRRRRLLSVGVAGIVVAATAGVTHGIVSERWISPVHEIDTVASADDSLLAGAADELARATPTSSPTPTVVPTPEPTAEAGSGLLGRKVAADLGGKLDVVRGKDAAPGKGTVRTVRVEVERGLPVDGAVFADAVMATLNDRRGWGSTDEVTFARGSGKADIRVVLASPATTDDLCSPLDTGGTLSCGVEGMAVLNFSRWVKGAKDFDGDLVTYRHYLVSHEVGHVLGHHHEQCTTPGKPAPVMVQQTISTGGCTPNGWPNP